jgi:hypothetical protein
MESQSSAAAAIVAGQGNVAGIGGFSGRESTVSPSWLATEVGDGRLRWVLADTGGTAGGAGGAARPGGAGITSLFGGGGSGAGGAGRLFPGASGAGSGRSGAGPSGGGPGLEDGRSGSERAFKLAEKVGRKVTFKVDGQTVTMYDLQGRAAAILAAAKST